MPIRAVALVEENSELPVGFDELVDRVYRYALSLTHDSAAAEDLVQDACLAMLSNGAPWQRAYFLAAVRNRFIDQYRRNRKVLFLAFEHDPSAKDNPVDTNWDGPDVLRNGQLDAALAKLKSDEREVLFLAVVEGYTAEEIGTMTARPRGTILSLLHRTKRKLRDLLEKDGAL